MGEVRARRERDVVTRAGGAVRIVGARVHGGPQNNRSLPSGRTVLVGGRCVRLTPSTGDSKETRCRQTGVRVFSWKGGGRSTGSSRWFRETRCRLAGSGVASRKSRCRLNGIRFGSWKRPYSL